MRPFRLSIAGADDFVETTQHSGVPLDPELFEAYFQTWVSGLRDADADIIAIYGKTSRRSHLSHDVLLGGLAPGIRWIWRSLDHAARFGTRWHIDLRKEAKA